MENNKVLSTLLMMTAMTSMVAGAFAVNKNVYHQAEAATAFKTVYLSFSGQITNPSGASGITWDTEEDEVKVYDNVGNIKTAGHKMSKIDTGLYACTFSMADSNTSKFIFRTMIGSSLYRSRSESVPGYNFKIITASNNLFALEHYSVASAEDDENNWSGYTVDNATDFAKTF